MEDYKYNILISLELINRIKEDSNTMNLAVGCTLLCSYHDLIKMDNIKVLNLIEGLSKSLGYLLKHNEEKYLLQVQDYLQDIYKEYLELWGWGVNENIVIEDREVAHYYSKVLPLDKEKTLKCA